MEEATYCVKEKRKTMSVPGSIEYKTTKNGRLLMQSVCSSCGTTKTQFISKKDSEGKGLDIHKLIGKLPKPKAGFTPSKYKYMGPYNLLENQLEYDKSTGEVTKWHVQPYNKVDEIAAHHDICYDMGKSKGECDKKMVKSLDALPYSEMPKWGQTARFLINAKQKLGLGIKSKNVKSRRVKKTGKKN